MENVLTILTMCIKMYALGVTCPTSLLLNLDVSIFAEVIQNIVIDKRGFVLTMENNYLNLGVTSEILNRFIHVMSAVTTYNVLYTFAFLRNSIQQLIAFRIKPFCTLCQKNLKH